MTKGYKRYKWHLSLHLDTTPRKQNRGLLTVYISVTLNNWQRRPCGTVCLGVNVPFLICLQVLPVRLHWCRTKACLARGTGHLNLQITLSYQYTIAKAIHVATHKFEVVDVWIDDLAEIIGVVVSLPSLNLPHSATHWHVRNHTTPPTPPHSQSICLSHFGPSHGSSEIRVTLTCLGSPVFETTSINFSCLLSTSYYLTVLEYFSVRHTAAAEHPRSPNNAVTLCRLAIGTCCTGRYLGCVAYVACAGSSANFSHLIPFLIPFLLYGTVCWYEMYEYDSVRPKNEVAANPAEELLVDVTCPPENRRASLTVCWLPAYAHSRLLQEVQ